MQGHRRRAVRLLAAAAAVGAVVATSPAGAEPPPPAPAPLILTVPGIVTVVVPVLLGGDGLGIAFDVHSSSVGLPLLHLGVPSLVGGLPLAVSLVVDTDLDVVGRIAVLGQDG
jgi:hypothetical protein